MSIEIFYTNNLSAIFFSSFLFSQAANTSMRSNVRPYQLKLWSILSQVFPFNLSIKIHSSMKIRHLNRAYFALQIVYGAMMIDECLMKNL